MLVNRKAISQEKTPTLSCISSVVTEQIHRQQYKIRTEYYVRKGAFRNQRDLEI